MGYRRNKTYLLTFEDPEFEGLEIRTRGLSINRAMQTMELAKVLDDREGYTTEELRALDTLMRIFAGCPAGCDQEHPELAGQSGGHFTSRIVSWNLEDEYGNALEPGYRAFTDQDADFTVDVLMAWLEGVMGTPGPLDGTSNDGKPPEVVSIPMETLSPALVS